MNRLLTMLVAACAALAVLYALLHFGGNLSPRAIAVNEPSLVCEDEASLTSDCMNEEEPPAEPPQDPAPLNAQG